MTELKLLLLELDGEENSVVLVLCDATLKTEGVPHVTTNGPNPTSLQCCCGTCHQGNSCQKIAVKHFATGRRHQSGDLHRLTVVLHASSWRGLGSRWQ